VIINTNSLIASPHKTMEAVKNAVKPKLSEELFKKITWVEE
jgi:hypothetical protein